MTRIVIAIQAQDFDINKELVDLRAVSSETGAIVNFTGLVRAEADAKNTIESLFLEHYPGMSEKIIQQHVEKACAKWPLLAVTVLHRIGELKVGEQIVWVAASSSHRQAAFAAAEFIMDFLKTEAPFWKKQKSAQAEQWVEAREKDLQALHRWSKKFPGI